MKPVTIAIAGCGSRGLNCYAKMQKRFPDRMKIVAATDLIPEKLEKARVGYDLDPALCFPSLEEMLKADKLADAMLVCTQDKDHYAHATAALRKGYHLLLEKPIALSEEECLGIQRLAEEMGLHVVVCHVLRYTVFYQKIKELIDSGLVGDVMNIQATEGVGYWHQAHSYVRGNWRNLKESSPMILAKSCHDLDIFLWLSGKHCLSVSSYGSLRHFRPENAPEGAPARCTDGCPAAETCPFNAERFYLGKVAQGNLEWPVNVLTVNPTHETVLEALKTGPYGRCVYRCDNDVVDHQIVNMEMEDGLIISFTMSAFSRSNARTIDVMGTRGQIRGDMEANIIRVMPFVGEPYDINVSDLTSDFSGHGGGDARLMDDFLGLLLSGGQMTTTLTSISRSVESHRVAFAAERSRAEGGRVVRLDE